MKKLAMLAAFALVSVASSAHAEDKTIKLHDYIVYGRAARPMVVTEVTRLPVASTLSVLQKPLDNRVEQAVRSAPF